MPEPITQEDVALIRASPWFQEEWYLERYPDVREASLDPARHYLEFGAAEARNPGPDFDSASYLRGNLDVQRAGLNPLVHFIQFGRAEGRMISSLHQQWIEKNDRLDKVDHEAIRVHIASFSSRPLISVIVPVYRTDIPHLRQMIDSVVKQSYPNWECCIADDCSDDPAILKLLSDAAREEPRILLTLRETNGNICAATNSALALATGEFVCFLDHDDLLHENALYEVSAELLAHPDADIVYSDSDCVDDAGHRYDPYFKPDWNYDLMLGLNLISHLGVYRRSLVEHAGGLRPGYEGSQDYDLALRIAELTTPERIRHIPAILYHWRRSNSLQSFSDKALDRCVGAARAAIADHLVRRGVHATVEACPKIPNFTRVVYSLPASPPLVTVGTIANGDPDSLVRCLSDVLRTDYAPMEVLVVRTEGYASQAHVALDRLEKSGLIRFHPVRAADSNAARNLLVEHASGEVVVLLDGELRVPDPRWLTELVSQALRPDVGLVGPILVDAEERIYGAGIVVGGRQPLTPVNRCFSGYFGIFALTREVSALHSHCLAFRRSVYIDAGGMTPRFPHSDSDVNFCLRVNQAGLRNLLTPHGEVVRSGSALDVQPIVESEMWGMTISAEDPFYNPNLSLDGIFNATSNPSRRIKPWSAIKNRFIIRNGQAMRAAMLLEGVPQLAKILEVGASYSPIAPRAEGWNTKIVDHACRAELVEKYKQERDVWVDRIEEVDFIWTAGSIADAVPDALRGSFDFMIASHVIEHVPDFISFLNSAEQVLSPSGTVILAVPDKRFCFDYFRPLSMTGDMLEANEEKRSRHTRRTAYEHWFYTVTRRGQGAWGQEPVTGLELSNPFAFAMSKLNGLSSAPDAAYVDLHVWKFCPSSFALILLELARMGKTDWFVDRITPAMGCEFHAFLRRGASERVSVLNEKEFDAKRLELLKCVLREMGQQASFAR